MRLHMQRKLRMSREAVLEAAVAAVGLARQLTDDVEFSAEDASRSDIDFLCRVIEAVINAGASTINIPDTVGYALPVEFGDLITLSPECMSSVSALAKPPATRPRAPSTVANSLSAV